MPSRRDLLAAVAGAGATAVGASPARARDPSSSAPPGFHDDFRDGDWRDDWRVLRREAGSIEIVDGPDGDGSALGLSQSRGGGTAVYVGWDEDRSGWSGPWTLSGAFYTERLREGHRSLAHQLRPFADAATDTPALAFQLGFRDGEAGNTGFGFREGSSLIDTAERLEPDWSADTRYEYRVTYDGDGTYGACLRDEDGPVGYVAAEGSPIPDASRVAGLLVNGADGAPLEMHHLFLTWEPGTTGTPADGERHCPQTGDTGGGEPASGEDGTGESAAGADGRTSDWPTVWSVVVGVLLGVPLLGTMLVGCVLVAEEKFGWFEDRD